MKSKAITKMQTIVIVAILLVAAVLAGVYFSGVLTPTPGPEVPTEILIGASLAISGRYALSAVYYMHTYQLWAEEVNKNGGLFITQYNKKIPVRLIIYDDQSDPTTAAGLYERLITQDKVNYVFSPYQSAIIAPVSVTCEKYKMPLIASGCADANYMRNLTYLFGTCLATYYSKPAINNILPTLNPQVKKLAIVGAKSLFHQILYDAEVQQFTAAGCQIVYQEQWELGTKDLSTVVQKAKAAQPDGFIVSAGYEDAVLLTRQMVEANWRAKFNLFIDGPNIQDFITAFGADANGLCCYLAVAYLQNNTMVNDFITKYKARWNNEYPTAPWSGMAWACVNIEQQAIEKAGTLNPEDMRKVLLNTTFQTVIGPFTYGSFGNFTNVNTGHNAAVNQIQNRTIVVIAPPAYADTGSKIIYPLTETFR